MERCGKRPWGWLGPKYRRRTALSTLRVRPGGVSGGRQPIARSARVSTLNMGVSGSSGSTVSPSGHLKLASSAPTNARRIRGSGEGVGTRTRASEWGAEGLIGRLRKRLSSNRSYARCAARWSVFASSSYAFNSPTPAMTHPTIASAKPMASVESAASYSSEGTKSSSGLMIRDPKGRPTRCGHYLANDFLQTG